MKKGLTVVILLIALTLGLAAVDKSLRKINVGTEPPSTP